MAGINGKISSTRMLNYEDKYICGSELQYTLDSLCNGYFLDILNKCLCCQFSYTISLSSSKCVLYQNIFPRLIKLTLLYNISLCRLVWLTEFQLYYVIQLNNICHKSHEILKRKKEIFCTSVAVFLLVLKIVKTWLSGL